ncbi:MAG TPA: hypothetical protein VFJ07_12805 [Streptosporangiaceae bacterium]|nr:hypothetical protein [Streptosporangiaceae bacterium]
MNRTQGREDRERHGAQQDKRYERTAGREATAEREASDHASQTGYRPSVNQRRHEPMPASRHDDLRQEAVIRNEEHARDGEQAQPSPRAPSRRAGRRDRG